MMEHMEIRRGKLFLVMAEGSFSGLGIRAVRKAIADIEASKRELAPSTKARLDVYRAGVKLWDAYKSGQTA